MVLFRFVSFATTLHKGCARENYNGVYARVSSATEWIQDMICELSDDPPDGCATRPHHQAQQATTGGGEVTLKVKYDSYPTETAYSFVHDDTGKQYAFSPFFSGAVNGQEDTMSWKGMPAGTYTLSIGDSGRDGICCVYGQGSISLINDKNNQVIIAGQETGDFTSHIAYTIEIKDNGQVELIGTTTAYENSWEAAEDVPNYPQNVDQLWPGPLAKNKKSLNINVKFDRFPYDTSWTFSKYEDGEWKQVEALDGGDDNVHNDLVSVPMSNLSMGWYRFSIRDNGGNGICCDYRRGWVAITGYLRATQDSGLVWGNNGEFGSGVDVYLLIDQKGFFRGLRYDEPTALE